MNHDDGRRRTPIADYGLIGDTRTAALVSATGSIDWMCAPRFDGDPVFGRLVAGDTGGCFSVAPAGRAHISKRAYKDRTTTIETRWEVGAATATVYDSMIAELGATLLPTTTLVRRVIASGGPVDVEVLFDPRRGPDRARLRERRVGGGITCDAGGLALSLTTNADRLIPPREHTVVTVTPSEPLTVVLGVSHRSPAILVPPGLATAAANRDEASWREWCSEIAPGATSRDIVVRSLITLRLLTYSPSGAPVAAPTTSLPEALGGVRNWDYRFAWPRDASIGIAAFLAAGKVREAEAFLAWLMHASRLDRPRLPPLLTLDGRRAGSELTLDGWPGYASSTPVRVGNGAAGQHQLDTYGWVIDALWLLVDNGIELHSEAWRAVRGFADEVATRWSEPDSGIWEPRGEPSQYVHSKLMAWLALDRALAIAGRRGGNRRRAERWKSERDRVAEDVGRNGRHPDGFYTRTYGSEDVDASTLLAPVIGMDDGDSDVTRRTIVALRERLSAGGPLLYRYEPGTDGIEGSEGAFLPCSFWLVQALARSGAGEEARRMFEELVDRASPLGLYGEEMDPATGEHLGNYPQALTHAALVQAALALRDSEAR